jgi:signal transduction histidine kinase
MFENTFSRRKGYTPPPVQGRLEELSDYTRNRLWDIFYLEIYSANQIDDPRGGVALFPEMVGFLTRIWREFYHRRIDEYPGADQLFATFKDDFIALNWHFPFDIFEAIFQFPENLMRDPDEVASQIRNALERENQAYTFVGGRFIERMTPQEVESVETALRTPIEAIREHFETALQMLSNRENPDFRNSIKESISAVESACKELTGLKNATLGQALNALHQKRPLHQNLKNALQQLYSWTSDHGGIRHAIKDAENVERADAKFMLVACSAFVNYLMTR